MRKLRKIGRAFAIATIVTAVITIIMLIGHIGLETVEHLEDEPKSPLNIVEALGNAASGNDLRNIVTAMAIAAGVAIAWYKLDIFREFEPHLTVEQTIQSRTLGDSYRLIVATVILTNNSKVLVRPREGYCRLAQLSPIEDREVIEIYLNALRQDDSNLEQFGWPVLGEIRRKWADGDIAIEPGECHQETYQFIVQRDTESVVALTAIYNPAYIEGVVGSAETWRCYTFHDVQFTLGGSDQP